ncbi:MAG: lipoprotein insertase outer membrane protein LolB, partial [Arenimonas sp.]
RRLLGAGVLLALLAGCSAAPPRPAVDADAGAQALREALLASQPDWGFHGRVALSQDGKGGNAGIRWRQHGTAYDIELQAPITRQSWRLHSEGGRVALEGLDGGRREGTDAEAMLLEATGWRIPVAAMTAWVRGARGSGTAQLAIDPQGRPATLLQGGWSVEYRGWFEGEPPLPQKLFARKDGASVRLVVEAWESP